MVMRDGRWKMAVGIEMDGWLCLDTQERHGRKQARRLRSP